MKKIIILYSTSGLGHYNSAKAIKEVLEKSKDIDVKLINILDYGNEFFRFLHFKFYVSLMKYAKPLWGALYAFAELPGISMILRKGLHFTDRQNWSGLEKILIEEKPDAIVSTHFFLTSLASAIKKHKDIKPKLYLMVSGFGMHNVWFSREIDHFFTGIESAKKEMINRGIPAGKVTVTGMPSPMEFCREYDVEDLKKTY
ncbi:MAG: hypothetical protein HQL28_01520, partial [Candidatus Omnitrophica bacterium]|nr:hypothetical protein [Candidatus Omnitrophota bacterium]